MSNADLVREAVNKHRALAVKLSDDLAARPELSGKEYEASRRIVGILKQAGYEVEYPFDGIDTAFRAALDNGEGPSVAVLVEYDALPEIGHGCGHNLHGSMAVLTALALAELKVQFKGRLFIIGTPAEEVDGAKVKMADDGVFDGMDMAMMIHSFSGGVAEPAMRCLALKCYNFTFRGQTAHAAACPWEGRNALTAVRKFIDLLDARREGFTPDVRVSTIILDGGKTPNVIPDLARVQVEFRAGTAPRLDKVAESVLKCAQGAALALDCDMEWEPDFPIGFFDLLENTEAENAVRGIFEGLGVKVRPSSPATGSSDIGNVSYRCPAVHPLLPITDEPVNLHTVEFANATGMAKAYDAMATGAEAMAILALRVFTDAEFRNAVREEFSRRVNTKQ